MAHKMDRTSPRVITSKRKIVYRDSKWRFHQFNISGGEESLCTAAVIQMNGSLLLWIGNASKGESFLNEIALGMPSREDIAECGKGLASALVGTEGSATGLARRLALLLKRPVFLCLGSEYDRFTMPLVERGLVAEIKSRPECFKEA